MGSTRRLGPSEWWGWSHCVHNEGEFFTWFYKLVITQQLLEGDYDQRKLFCEQMQSVFNDNDNITLFTSDEAHFHLNGFVNRQNFRYWGAENPRELHEKPLHSPRVTVWCAVGKNTVIGPYFFEENGVTVTVNSDRYLTMLNEFFIPQLRRKRIPLRNVWFQQDGATCHTSNATMTFLRQKFPGRLISRRGDVSWPPRSPDLSPCDFFLWGYLKERVYREKPRTLHELKEAITEEIRRIPRAMLGRVATSFISRLDSCITADGRHMLDVNFRTWLYHKNPPSWEHFKTRNKNISAKMIELCFFFEINTNPLADPVLSSFWANYLNMHAVVRMKFPLCYLFPVLKYSLLLWPLYFNVPLITEHSRNYGKNPTLRLYLNLGRRIMLKTIDLWALRP